MNIEQARFNMIEQQIRTWDVLDTDVLDLLFLVKREAFVPAAYASLAFVDTEIPLNAEGEAMFTPKMEARILQEMGLKKHENVLEIGAGSGYMAALLAYKARHVTTVEIDPQLKAFAEKNLAAYGVSNVDVVQGNGAQGWAAGGNAQYDAIVVSGSLPVLPDAFLTQLTVGGRLFVIIGEAPVMTAQIITRTSDTTYTSEKLFETNVKALREAVVPSHFKF
jgi:protein-L-isoaspartate(D-aspartate) O-methyltransferase